MPTVNYVRDVLPFDQDVEQFGSTWTDAQIANIIEGQTLSPITIGSARKSLPVADWWKESQAGFTGVFQTYYDDPSTPVPVKDFLDTMWEIIFGIQGRSDVGTTLVYNKRGKIAPSDKQGGKLWKDFFDWTRGLDVNSQLSEEDIEDFYADGNGLKYTEAVAAADVAASRDAYNAESELDTNKDLLDQEFRRLYNVHIAPIQASSVLGEVTDQAYKDALIAMSAGWVDQL